MDRIELFLTKLYDFCIRNNRIITPNELYSYINRVDEFNKYDETLFYDICDYPEIYLQSYEEKKLLKGLKNDLYYYFSNELSYKRIEVGYSDTVKIGMRDVIKLYIPLQGNDLVNASKVIFKVLFNEKIPFIAKISKKKRLDGFIIRLFSKDAANKVINECKNFDNFLDLNPFIPTINKIGIARDTYGISYQFHLCKILSNYCLKCMNNINNEIFTVNDFKNYLNSLYSNNLTNKENFMNNVVIDGINSILNNTNILDTFSDSYDIKYEPINYEYDEVNNSYSYDGLYVKMDNNLNLFIDLQVNRFLKILHELKTNNNKQYILNEKIVAYVSNLIDKENDAYENVKITHKIKNEEIKKLIPYFYAYFGINKRKFDSYKALDIIQKFK